MEFKKGDKVLFKENQHSYYQDILKLRGFDYYLVAKVINNYSQRHNKTAYRIILPDKQFIVNASAKQLSKFKALTNEIPH